MKDYYKIQSKTLGTRIGRKDIVSGAFFQRFVKEYHAYDRRQKELIGQLQTEIEQLQEEKNQLREERDKYMNALASIADYTGKKKRGDLKDKIRRQKSAISQLILETIRLKDRLRKLTIKI